MSVSKMDVQEVFNEMIGQENCYLDRVQNVMAKYVQKDASHLVMEKEQTLLDQVVKTKKQEVEEKQEKEKTSIEIKQEIYQAAYESLLKEYYDYKFRIYQRQVKRDELNVLDKEYIELTQYEVMLRKMDVAYQKSLGRGRYISMDDEKIKKVENNYSYQDAIYQRTIFSSHEKSLEKIDELNDKLEEKSRQIKELSQGDDTQAFQHTLEEYTVLNGKMHTLSPGVLEINREQDKYRENEEHSRRAIGPLYAEQKERKVMDRFAYEKQKSAQTKEQELQITDRVDSADIEIAELMQTNKTTVIHTLTEAEEAIEQGDFERAKKMLTAISSLFSKKELDELVQEKVSPNKQEMIEKMIEGDFAVEKEEGFAQELSAIASEQERRAYKREEPDQEELEFPFERKY